ncbi:MAG: hypothetical protein ACD_79C00293G0001, partial [uncultured bacterium]
MTKLELEKYSSAFTLSDMEIFIFPELMYSLVLANIISPQIWKWKESPFLKDIEEGSFNKRVQRLKQYIMDNYAFNLDLDTWGLTSKEKEMNRFKDFIDLEIIRNSNALFGYEGDKYYFDIDIRRHFGLDKYNDDAIPYWKTETVEAMDAFKFKKGHNTGAGECVSLAVLYAAALFIVLKVPLEEIFLMATPLHSQNFITLGEGIITNNRRILTKKMWFNGTELSQKARRALENENVTIVSHVSGYSHIAYKESTIDSEQFNRFSKHLKEFMIQPIDFEVFANFLRINNEYQKYFQYEYFYEGHNYFINAERLYQYEHSSKNRVGDSSYKKFLEEIELEEFSLQPSPDRDTLNVVKQHLNGNTLYCQNENGFIDFKKIFKNIPDTDEMGKCLRSFVCGKPRIPDNSTKKHIKTNQFNITTQMTREEILEHIKSKRKENTICNLAFSAGRYVDESNWDAYIKACIERNPCSLEFFKNCNEITTIYEYISK